MWKAMMFWTVAPLVSWVAMTRIFPLVASSNNLPPPKCEGYYPPTEICLKLGTTRPSIFQRTAANAQCPQWKINETWKGRDEFIEKLTIIETITTDWQKILEDMTPEQYKQISDKKELYTPTIALISQRGLAWSRMEEGVMAGNKEFRATGSGDQVCWTSAFLNLYVQKYGVEPSASFKEFVFGFDLEEYLKKLETLKNVMASSTTTTTTE